MTGEEIRDELAFQLKGTCTAGGIGEAGLICRKAW